MKSNQLHQIIEAEVLARGSGDHQTAPERNIGENPPEADTPALEWIMPNNVVNFDAAQPTEFTVDGNALAERRQIFYGDARELLWDPTDLNQPGVFAIGMEAAQFPQPLHTLLSMAGKAGCQIIQPTGRANHLDLRRAATDDNYRAWFRAKFMEHKVPMVSVSLHVVFYALLCIKHNPAAMQWVPEDCRRATPAETEAALWNAIVMMLIGAAVTGIEVIHLFFGKSEGLGDYPWDPYGTKDVAAMDAKTVGVLNALGKICIKLGIKLGHEIHPATMARSMRDFARVWKQLDKDVQQVIGLGFDPSHFWDGETWEEALWLAKELGIPVFVAHAKNALKREGFSAHGQEPLYTWRGQAFTHLDDPAGIVSMHQYLEKLQLLGAPFWFARGVPMGVHVEAEVQVRRQIEVTERGVGYLRHTIIGPMGWHPADGDFTDAMKS